ncbi:MAG: flagellar hook-associated protein FlgK [Pseudomonadales bacterium]|nr:flagellar hook-associated protein FlgK [Pseudomonadales bacterium]
MAAASLLRIGVSGLLSNQSALRTTGHNIANTDTPGYSRQRVDVSTQTPQFSGAGFQGTGVKIESVRRIVDDFAINQLRLDSTAFNELESYSNNISQIDSLLADVSTGIAPGVQEFFASLGAAADDPTSIPIRQLVLSQADGLIDRFESVQTRLDQQNNTINLQLDTIARSITSIADGIANLNNNIVAATGRAQDSPPNDLLDSRDELLRQLSEFVSVSVVNKPGNAVDVFIGNGQALVIGIEANEIRAVPGETDATRRDLAFVAGDVQQNVTRLISGGELGGLLSFRSEVLDTTINNVGRLAITLADNINGQHRLGLDLDGIFGGLFFSDINEQSAKEARVVADRDNTSGNETRLSVAINDTNQLTGSDYILAFPGPGTNRYALTRVSNGEVVQQGVLSGATPETIQGEGFEITIDAGEAQARDRFLIQPTRFGARDIALELDLPARLAIASVISANSSLGNEGTAKIASTAATDLSTRAFEVPGELSPPIVIQFTSATTYDVLDNSDPKNPIDLVPPIRNLRFTPGVENQMLPSAPGQTAVTSDGLLAGSLPDNPVLIPIEGPATNGYVPEMLTLTTVDPVTGITSIAPAFNVSAGEPASVIASRLTDLNGVNATARSRVFLSDIVNQEEGMLPMVITINGVQVNQPTDPNEPELLGPNYLADIISQNPDFAALGITAKSDGERLTLESLQGDDINIAIRGDARDQFLLTDLQGKELLMEGAGGSTPAVVDGTVDRSAGYDFGTGGPYTFKISVNGGTTETVVLDSNQILGSDVVREIQRSIDETNIAAGDVIVALQPTGLISLTTRETGPDAVINIIDVSPATRFALGFEAGLSQGADVRNAVTVGGVLNVVLDEGISLTSSVLSVNGNLFTNEPTAVSTFLGYQVSIDGIAKAGDKFTVGFNRDGVSDNRNGLALTALEVQKVIDNSSVSFLESYGKLVEFVGALTSQSLINSEASESLLQQSQLSRDAVAGVNLDEEAADLIRYELAYNASAQVISVARTLFDTLINTFR